MSLWALFVSLLTFLLLPLPLGLPLLRLLFEPILVQLLTSQPASAGFLELHFRVGQGFQVSLLSVAFDPLILVLFQLLLCKRPAKTLLLGTYTIAYTNSQFD